MTMFDWSGVTATCEVWGLFSHLVPPVALDREEVVKQKSVMRPDYRLEMVNKATDQKETRLAELKYYCGWGLYKVGVKQHHFKRAVEARAEEVIREYKAKADRMDELLGEQPGQGRVRARLDEFGEVIPIISGLFNEVNNSTMALIESMAASRVDKLVRSSGLQFRAREKEKGEVVGELRVLFSVTSLRSADSLPAESGGRFSGTGFKEEGGHSTGGGGEEGTQRSSAPG